ncbi:hypothetical protein A9Q99_02545 [Gammaproteobacteria bacterium 45_16_T64]|nr:hypothetical protein A9Q99_02545 [Gammaproteobacteria bacterium 45_16_T64]
MQISNKVFNRVAYSVIGNVTRALLSFITGILLARGLGPAEYGVFGFLLASFTALTQLLDMGSSNAFITFISQRIRSKSYLLYYGLWILLQFLFSIILIVAVVPDDFLRELWHGESRERVFVSFVAVFLQNKVWQAAVQIGESQRFTHIVQAVSVSIACVHLIIIVLLFWSGRPSIEFVYGIVAVEFFLGSCVAIWFFPLRYSKDKEAPSAVIREYGKYCYPLVPTVWVAVLTGFADTWLLQRFGGAIEQAYYVVALQFSVVSLIATRSVLNILWKEVSEAYQAKKVEVVRKLFTRTTKSLYCLGAMISGALIPWVDEIISIFLGDSYLAGSLVMMIMFIYPIDQARGQVAGTMLLAMEMTKSTLVLGVVSNVIGVLLTYFLLAPADANVPGLGLGASGLALKMVVVQFFTVNVSLWWISRRLGMKAEWLYQFYGLFLFLFLGYLTNLLVNLSLGSSTAILLRMLLNGLGYLVLIGVAIYKFPSLIGLSHAQARELFAKVRSVCGM